MSDANATTPRVFIARHGETEWTISGQCTGNAEILLTPNGEAQSRGTGQMLVGPGKLIDPCKLARVISSPRKRAVATLDLLLDKEAKGALESAGKIDITEDIAEWDYGKYEGLTPAQIKARRAEQGKGSWNIWTEGCEDGEYVLPTLQSPSRCASLKAKMMPTYRTPDQVQVRLDRLIKKIYTIQEPFMHGGPAPDVLVVRPLHRLSFPSWAAALACLTNHPLTVC